MKQGVPLFCKDINSSIKIKPWIKDGSHILVCPPDNIIASLMGFNECDWLTDVLKKLKNNTDRKILVRSRDKSKVTSIKQDLANAFALVTWTSNAAVDALLEGVPVFCTGDCGSSWMGKSDPVNIEYPMYPDNRSEWVLKLLSNQWTFDEMSSGQAWSELNEKF